MHENIMTLFTNKKSSGVILHQLKKDCFNVSILCASQNNRLMTSHHEAIAHSKARLLFQTINSEIIYNFCIEKCKNKAFENTDTFGG